MAQASTAMHRAHTPFPRTLLSSATLDSRNTGVALGCWSGGRGSPPSNMDSWEVAKAVWGGYCRLQMPLRLALGVWAGHRLGALEGGGGGSPPSNASLVVRVLPQTCLMPQMFAPYPLSWNELGAIRQVLGPKDCIPGDGF